MERGKWNKDKCNELIIANKCNGKCDTCKACGVDMEAINFRKLVASGKPIYICGDYVRPRHY